MNNPDEHDDRGEAPRCPVYDGIEWFACWLLDHAEGETITEELLRPWAMEARKAHLKRRNAQTQPSADETNDPPRCTFCSGTGEGGYLSRRCQACGGSGVEGRQGDASRYHPNLDGPAEPVGLAMKEEV